MTNRTNTPSLTLRNERAAALIPLTYDLRSSDAAFHLVRRVSTVEELIERALRRIAVALYVVGVTDPWERGTAAARPVSEIMVGTERGYRSYTEEDAPRRLAAGHLMPKFAFENRIMAGWESLWAWANDGRAHRVSVEEAAAKLPGMYADLVVLCDQSAADGSDLDRWAREHVVGLGEDMPTWTAVSSFGEKGWRITRGGERKVELPYVVLDEG